MLSIVENNHVSLKRKISNTNQTYLWHLCLGQINLYMIQRLVKSRALYSLVPKDLPVCESYIEGKITKRPFTTKGVRAKACLKLVHIDVYELFNVQACGGYEYFITFTNDYSRYGYVYLMHRNSNALDKFKECKVESKNQLGKRLKVL